MRKNKFRKAYRVKRKKTAFRNRFLRLLILLFILLAEIFYILFFSPVFQIKNIQIYGNEAISDTEIEKRVREEMLAEYGDNVFLFGPNKIKNTLLGVFPEIANLNLIRNFPNSLKIEIQEREPAAVFCLPAGQAGQNEDCFIIDKEGMIFEKYNNTANGLPYVKSQIFDNQARLGVAAIEENLLSKIIKINNQLKDCKIDVEKFSVISDQRLNAETAESWEIYFNLKGDIEWQITELAVILNAKIPLPNRKSLQYIDLRFDKVFIFPEGVLAD